MRCNKNLFQKCLLLLFLLEYFYPDYCCYKHERDNKAMTSDSKPFKGNEDAAENQPEPSTPPMPSWVDFEGTKLFTVAAAWGETGLEMLPCEEISAGEHAITSELWMSEKSRKMVDVCISRDFSQIFRFEFSRALTLESMLITHLDSKLIRPEHSGIAPKPYFWTSSTLKTGLFWDENTEARSSELTKNIWSMGQVGTYQYEKRAGEPMGKYIFLHQNIIRRSIRSCQWAFIPQDWEHILKVRILR